MCIMNNITIINLFIYFYFAAKLLWRSSYHIYKLSPPFFFTVGIPIKCFCLQFLRPNYESTFLLLIIIIFFFRGELWRIMNRLVTAYLMFWPVKSDFVWCFVCENEHISSGDYNGNACTWLEVKRMAPKKKKQKQKKTLSPSWNIFSHVVDLYAEYGISLI